MWEHTLSSAATKCFQTTVTNILQLASRLSIAGCQRLGSNRVADQKEAEHVYSYSYTDSAILTNSQFPQQHDRQIRNVQRPLTELH